MRERSLLPRPPPRVASSPSQRGPAAGLGGRERAGAPGASLPGAPFPRRCPGGPPGPGLAGVRPGAAGHVRQRGREEPRPAPRRPRVPSPGPLGLPPAAQSVRGETEASPQLLAQGAKPGSPRPGFCVPEHPARGGGEGERDLRNNLVGTAG